MFYFYHDLDSASVDPCVHLEIIDDVSRNTGYSLQQQEHPRCDRIQPKWYRYLDSDRGVMATSCPTGSQCGTISQVWMNGYDILIVLLSLLHKCPFVKRHFNKF